MSIMSIMSALITGLLIGYIIGAAIYTWWENDE